MAHHHHRTLRLKKPKRSSVQRQSLAITTRATQEAGSDSDSSHAENDAGPSEPADTLEARRRAAEEARKLEKAQRYLDMEVKGVTKATLVPSSSRPSSIHTNSLVGQAGSVSSEQGSYLDRLASQTSRPADQAEATDDEDDLHRSNHGPPGVVRRMAERHHRKVEKRDKKRRTERLRRIAALDPLQEGTREHGQAKETKFLALVRKYGPRAQEEARKARSSDMSSAGGERGSRFDLVEDNIPGTSIDASSMEEQSSYMVDTLDIVDPGVSTAGHLSNIGNSLIFPNIPGLYDRRPIIDLPSQDVDPAATQQETQLQMEEGRLRQKVPLGATGDPLDEDDLHLDAYIHELLTKRQKLKRTMQGVWAFLKTPIGVIFGIYGFLVVFGGAALVLFLVGAIDNGKNKVYWIEVFSQFENALFTIPGVGLIPWRVRDTYRMGRIAHYQHLTWKLRKRLGLAALPDKNDIPSLPAPFAESYGKGGSEKDKRKKAGSRTSLPTDHKSVTADGEIELQPTAMAKTRDDSSSMSSFAELDSEEADLPALPEDAVLSLRQAANLHRLQKQFADSQSWYRPHETFTHHAFSISYAVWITAFNDLNSIFQCALCGVMWGYATHYQDRPAWTTGTFMPISFLAGIASAVLIWQGGEKSKKQREVEEKLLDAFARDIDEQVQLTRMRADAQFRNSTTLPSAVQPGVAALPTVDEHPPDLDTLAHRIAPTRD